MPVGVCLAAALAAAPAAAEVEPVTVCDLDGVDVEEGCVVDVAVSRESSPRRVFGNAILVLPVEDEAVVPVVTGIFDGVLDAGTLMVLMPVVAGPAVDDPNVLTGMLIILEVADADCIVALLVEVICSVAVVCAAAEAGALRPVLATEFLVSGSARPDVGAADVYAAEEGSVVVYVELDETV